MRDLLHIAGAAGHRRVKAAARFLPRTSLAGERLPALFPHLAESVLDGSASVEHAEIARRELEQLPDAVSLAERDHAEAHLATLARDWDPHALHTTAVKLGHVLDPDAVLAMEEEQHARQEFTLVRDLQGMWRATGRFDAEAATVLTAALDPLGRPVKQSDGTSDPRPATQRRAEALVESVRMGLDHDGRSPSGGQRPHLLITTTLAELETKAGLGEWATGQPASIEMVLRQACTADATLAAHAGNGRLLYYGWDKRSGGGQLRQALIARDRGCVHDGCDAPPGHCDVHHVIPWSDGGTTNIHNTELRCRRHHRLIHHSGWQSRMIDGVPHTVPPPWIDPSQTPRRNRVRARRSRSP